MALARSASGPGGLSINTTSANSLFGSGTAPAGGMFGSTQASKPLFGALTTTTAPQTGGLFGSTATTSQPQTGGLFGSTAAASQPQTGGLFGSAPAASQPQTGGLFGSTAPTSQPQTGELFGSTAATSQPQTGGLFGSGVATSQPQAGGLFGSTTTTQPQAGGLFGAAAATSQPQAGGLFGSNMATSQPQAGGLFGSTTTSSQPQTGGLFGSSQQSSGLFGGAGTQPQNQSTAPLFGGVGSQPQQPSLFSQPSSGPAPSLGGGLTMGQSRLQQQQTVPGVKIDTANLRGTTRFADLHEELQKQIEAMDNVIQGQIKLKNDCAAIMTPHDAQLSSIPADVEFCRRKLVGLESAMAADADAIAHIRAFIKTDAEHAKLSFRAVDNLKLPPQYHVTGAWPAKPSTPGDAPAGASDAQNLVGLFSGNADELAGTLARYRKHIGDIELHLRSVEESSAQQVTALIARRGEGGAGDGDEVRQLAAALAEFERGILHVAGKVGGLREGVQSLQLGGFMGAASASGNRPTNGYRRGGVY